MSFVENKDFKMYGTGDANSWAVGIGDTAKQTFGMLQQALNGLAKDWGLLERVIIDRKIGKDTLALAKKVASTVRLNPAFSDTTYFKTLGPNYGSPKYLAIYAPEIIGELDTLFASPTNAALALNWNTKAVTQGESGIIGTLTGSKNDPSSPPAGSTLAILPAGIGMTTTEMAILGVLGFFVWRKYNGK